MGWLDVLKTIGMIAVPGGVRDPRDLGGSRDMMYKYSRDDVRTGGDPISGIPLGGQYAHLLPPDQPEDQYTNPGAEPFAESKQTAKTEDAFSESAKAPYISPETAPYRPATAGVQVPQDYGRSQETPFAKVQLNKAVQDYYNVRNNPPQKLSRGKAALSGLALAGMDMQGIMGQRNLDDKQAFGMAVGDALSRVIGGLVAPGATARQVQDVRENKALQDLSKSQEIYNQDVGGRAKEQAIETADANEGWLRARPTIEGDRNDIKQIDALVRIYKSSPKWKSADNMALNELLSKAAGATIVLPDKEAKVKVYFKEDAGTDRLWMTKIDENGHTISEDYVRDKTGEPARFQNPKVRQSLIQAAQAGETATLRAKVDYAKLAQAMRIHRDNMQVAIDGQGIEKKKAILGYVEKAMKTYSDDPSRLTELNLSDDEKAKRRQAAEDAATEKAMQAFGVPVPAKTTVEEDEE